MIYEMITILIFKIKSAQFSEDDSLTSEKNERRNNHLNMISNSTIFQIDENSYAMNGHKTFILQTDSTELNQQIGEESLHLEVDQPLTESLIGSSCINKFPYIDEDSVSYYENIETPPDDFNRHVPSSKFVISLDLESSSDDYFDVTDILESIICETGQESSDSVSLNEDLKTIKEKVTLVEEDVTQDGENLIENSKMDPKVLDELYVSFLLLNDSKDVKAGQYIEQEQQSVVLNSTNALGRSSILKVSKKKSDQQSPEVTIFGYKPIKDEEVNRNKCVRSEDSKVKKPKKKKSSSSCFGCFLRSKRNHFDSKEFNRYKKKYVY